MKHSEALAKALTELALRTFQADLDALLAEYDKLQEAFVRTAPGQDERREVMRRIAERRMFTAIEREASSELCWGAYRRISSLGFTDVEREFTVRTAFARYCWTHGDRESALGLLDEATQAVRLVIDREETSGLRMMLELIDEQRRECGQGDSAT